MKEIKGGFVDIESGERHHATGSLVFLIQKMGGISISPQIT
jgi:hypothetical protein